MHRHGFTTQGFTLLEVLVALAILATAVTLVLQLFSTNLRSITASEDYVRAVIAADARMREISQADDLEQGAWEEIDGPYTMKVVISEALQEKTDLLPLRLLQVELTLNWRKGLRSRSMTLTTARLVSKLVPGETTRQPIR
jgi:prepilin-type N-terminal cleavage/methylation domain-containing protein